MNRQKKHLVFPALLIILLFGCSNKALTLKEGNYYTVITAVAGTGLVEINDDFEARITKLSNDRSLKYNYSINPYTSEVWISHMMYQYDKVEIYSGNTIKTIDLPLSPIAFEHDQSYTYILSQNNIYSGDTEMSPIITKVDQETFETIELSIPQLGMTEPDTMVGDNDYIYILAYEDYDQVYNLAKISKDPFKIDQITSYHIDSDHVYNMVLLDESLYFLPGKRLPGPAITFQNVYQIDTKTLSIQTLVEDLEMPLLLSSGYKDHLYFIAKMDGGKSELKALNINNKEIVKSIVLNFDASAIFPLDEGSVLVTDEVNGIYKVNFHNKEQKMLSEGGFPLRIIKFEKD